MARPREFDRDAALQTAMEAFWELGYEGASTAELEQRMGIGRSSFYSAFGSKDALYVEAMALYIDDLRDRVIAPLRKEGAAREVLERFFNAVADRGRTGRDAVRACMVVRAAVTGATALPEIATQVEASIRELDDAFCDLLVRGREDGTLRVVGSPRETARYLTSLFQALNVAVRAGRSHGELRQIARRGLGELTRSG